MFSANQTRSAMFSIEAHDNMPVFQSCNIKELPANVSFFQGSIWPLFVVFQPVIESICFCISRSLFASFCTAQGLLFMQYTQEKLMQGSVSEQLDDPDGSSRHVICF